MKPSSHRKGLADLHLGVMGKSTFRDPNLSPEQLDGKTWLAMGCHFDHITIVALSSGLTFQRGTTANVTVLLLPKLPGLLGSVAYWLGATVAGIALTYRHGIKVWSLSEPVSGLVAFPIKLLTPARIVFQLQGELFTLPAESYSRLKSWGVRLVTRWVCSVSDRVRAVSLRVRDQAVTAGVPAEKVVVVPSRTDSRVFNPALYLALRGSAREQLGVPEGASVIVFVGRLVATKGVTYLLQAVTELAAFRHDFRVLIVGGGPLGEQLELEASALGVSHLVTFYGAVPYSDVPKMLSLGDVFVAPSLDEGMPRTVLEALAMALPVVVTDVGGNAEILSKTDCGYLIKPRDVSGIIQALGCLLDNPADAKRRGLRGRQLVLEHYDFVHSIAALADVHKALVQGPCVPGREGPSTKLGDY